MGEDAAAEVAGAVADAAAAADNHQCAVAPSVEVFPMSAQGRIMVMLHHYLATASFTECLVRTVNQSGDADTQPAHPPATLAGPTYGPADVPTRERDRHGRKVTKAVHAQVPLLLAFGRDSGR